MTARQQRRQAERKARKVANKAQSQQPFPAAAAPAIAFDESFDRTPGPPVAPFGFGPQSSRLDNAAVKRAAINRANARHSTGPRTPEGKAASSQNNFRHGLTGNFAVLAWEDLDRFVELSFQLHEEHQPITMTEFLLVERMAQHQWLSQRALYLQNTCFHTDLPFCEQEKQLALYLRYGATHDRAFHKCLSDLLKLRAQKAQELRGFESQKRQAAAETRKQELHDVRIRRAAAPNPFIAQQETSSASDSCRNLAMNTQILNAPPKAQAA